jgi:hypothetical protein
MCKKQIDQPLLSRQILTFPLHFCSKYLCLGRESLVGFVHKTVLSHIQLFKIMIFKRKLQI